MDFGQGEGGFVDFTLHKIFRMVSVGVCIKELTTPKERFRNTRLGLVSGTWHKTLQHRGYDVLFVEQRQRCRLALNQEESYDSAHNETYRQCRDVLHGKGEHDPDAESRQKGNKGLLGTSLFEFGSFVL